MKKLIKLTAVLMSLVLTLTLSVGVSADDNISTSTEQILKIDDADTVTPLMENSSIINNGVYRIKNVGSGKYLNLHYGVDADGTNIYQWTADGSTEQKWRVSYNYSTQAYQFYSMSSSGGKIEF